MAIIHRAHPHSSDISENGDTSYAEEMKDNAISYRRRKQRRWSKTISKEEVEDWILIGTCAMVFFLCGIWFLGKVFAVVTWFLPAMDSLVLFAGRKSTPKHQEWKEVPFNPAYAIPHAHKLVGDRSHHYAILRQDIDAALPENRARSLQRVQELQKYSQVHAVPTLALDRISDEFPRPAYDIYNCPSTPPEGYPFQWNLLKVVENWSPENTTVPSKLFNGLCTFDYERDYDKAMTYRNAELPFVVKRDPRIAATAERWNSQGYMERLLGDVLHRTSKSDTNHFLYAIPPPPSAPKRFRGGQKKKHQRTAPPGWKEPTEALRMSYSDWLDKANVTDDMSAPNKPHWYYRLIGCGLTGPDGSCDKGSSEYLYDELPFFQPTPGDLYLRDAEKQKGIHCRFGQKGIIADNHFDAGRNTIVVLGGSRRYILASPDQCLNMALFDKRHPSARHSEVNWSNPDLERFPQFAQALGNEVILEAGDALYLPNNWFHHIISLELNFQCNTRSGWGQEYMDEIRDCGFDEH